jgi:ABC-type phosphate transport system substrate-binding protein
MKLVSIRAAVFILAMACTPASPSPQPAFDVIVNQANATLEASVNDLRDVLLGTLRQWPNRRRITVVQRDPGSPVVADVIRSVLGMSVREYNRHLLDLEFRGKGAVPLKAMASDEAVCDFVSNAPGAIGFVPSIALRLPLCRSNIRVLAIRR